MEKLVNEIMFKLNTKLSINDLEIVRNVLYSTLQDYDITKKTYEVSIPENDLPKEAKIYLVSKKIDGLSERSLDQYKRTIINFFQIINKPVIDVKTEDCRLFFYTIQNKSNMSNLSLDNQRAYINAFFMWLNDNDYIPKNPCRAIKSFKYEKKYKKALTEMELEILRNACKNAYETAIIEVIYATACRVSELVNIKLSDIDFNSGELIIFKGKGNKDRVTYLKPRTIIAIQEYIKDRNYDTVYLFENSRRPHNKLSTRAIEKKAEELEKRTGIRLYPHKIRRTTATHLLKNGCPVEEIKEILGHEDINTTLRYAIINKDKIKTDYQKYL